MWPALETLLPSAGLLFLLYLVLRHMMEGDRRERMAQTKWEQEHAAVPTPEAGGETIESPSAGIQSAENTTGTSRTSDDL